MTTCRPVRSQTIAKTFTQEFPAPAYLKQAFGHPPGKIYADRDFIHTLERAFRGPFQINQDAAAREANRPG